MIIITKNRLTVVSLFLLLSVHINIFFFDFYIKFGKTKQIIIALVATAFKALFSVAKASVRFSGCKLYAGNI